MSFGVWCAVCVWARARHGALCVVVVVYLVSSCPAAMRVMSRELENVGRRPA